MTAYSWFQCYKIPGLTHFDVSVVSRALDDPDLFPVKLVHAGKYKIKVYWIKKKEIFDMLIDEQWFKNVIVLEDGYGKHIFSKHSYLSKLCFLF